MDLLRSLRSVALTSAGAERQTHGPAVSVRGLEKRFGAVTALQGVDLDLPKRHLLAVLGPNGAGKSTLVRILAGLMRPTAGRVEVADAAGKNRYHARARIGFVGHATLLYPELTARENLIFTGRMHGLADPQDRADRLLKEQELERFADRRTGTFSRGLAQRLSIARALVHDPALLLLDEPFTGLDRPSSDRLAGRLRELRDRGRSLALVTHDLFQASELADAVLLLVGGRPVFRAARDEITPEGLEEIYRQQTGGAP